MCLDGVLAGNAAGTAAKLVFTEHGSRDQRETEMARAYSAILATVALSLAITRGLVLGKMHNEILVQCLWFFVGFAFIGYVIGYIAEKVVTESLESRFRSKMSALHAQASQQQKESSEQTQKLG